MSKRRNIERHIRSLDEISNIMGALKNLAVIETQKVTRLLASQERVLSTMQEAATDFLRFYPETIPDQREGRPLYILIGSERGFCGEYNDQLLAAVQEHMENGSEDQPICLAVGRKLVARLSESGYRAIGIDGASVAEEIQGVMIRVMEEVRTLRKSESSKEITLTVLSHVADAAGIRMQTLQPFERSPVPSTHFNSRPLLNVPPQRFLAELLELYWFSLLHKIFYSALLAENRARMSHLERAKQRLEKEASQLTRRRNSLRQEEITEEIELLMLSAERFQRPDARPRFPSIKEEM